MMLSCKRTFSLRRGVKTERRSRAMSQQRNPRYFASSWYTTKFAEEPQPAAWYWHDDSYTWHGPYETEDAARRDLVTYEREHSVSRYRRVDVDELLRRSDM
jgi:hypothetical protein